ncbi:unnamed protein product [Nezara viridula]|uniref:Uncharacterized protein n=1 Tax=Nezara viridula TaxID=85310 RepID=A0A9P0MTP0_NEZVI|nr:unnamed protein product [Nezara viridula]
MLLDRTAIGADRIHSRPLTMMIEVEYRLPTLRLQPPPHKSRSTISPQWRKRKDNTNLGEKCVQERIIETRTGSPLKLHHAKGLANNTYLYPEELRHIEALNGGKRSGRRCSMN